MAIKKKSERMEIPIEGEDAAVEAAFGGRDIYQRIERARRMTPAQRKKSERDAQRNKVTYDLPADLSQEVEVMAREVYHCPACHLAALLMRAGLREIGRGKLDVYQYRVTANSPRFEFFLDLTNFEGGKK